MLKKIWAIVLSLALVLSVFPVTGVFAASKYDNEVDEDFEGTGYNNRITNIGASTTNTATISVVAEGRNGGNALQVENLAKQTAVGVTYVAPSSAVAAYLSYDICFKKFPENITGEKVLLNGFAATRPNSGGQTFVLKQIVENGENKYIFYDERSTGKTKICDAEENKWYTVKWGFSGSTGTLFTELIDDTGRALFKGNVANNSNLDTGLSLVGANSTSNDFGDGIVLIDNVYHNSWVRSTYGPSVVSSSLDSVIESVPVDTNSVTVCFDSLISSSGNAILKTAEGTTIETCARSYVLDSHDTASGARNKLSLTWQAELTYGTTYKLDLTGLKNDQSKVVEGENNIITFKVEEEPKGPAVLTSTISNGATDISVDTKSVTVSFDQALSVKSAILKAPGIEDVVCTVAEVAGASNTYTISWQEDLSGNVTYTLDLTGSKNAASLTVGSTGVIKFTTEITAAAHTVLRDDFEDTSEFYESGGDYLYGKSGTKPFSSGSTKHGAFPVTGYGNKGTAAEIRYNHKVSSGSRATLYSAQPYVFGANDAVVVTYKMKISNAEVGGTEGAYTGGTNAWIGTRDVNNNIPAPSQVMASIDLDGYTGEHYIGAGDNSSVASMAGRQGFYYDEDVWYNVTYAITNSGANFTLTDISTGEILWNYSKTMSYSAGTAYYIGLVGMKPRTEDGGENGEGAAVTIDDVSLWTVNADISNKNDLTAIATSNENVVTFNFNQPTLVTADMLKVYKGDELNIEVEDVDFSIAYPNDVNFAKNIVTVLGLEPGETYTLEYPRITSAGGASFAAGETVTKLITISAPDTTMMTAAEYNETTGKVNLKFWAQGNETAGRFIAAFYQADTAKNLVAAAVSENENFVAGKNEIEISVTKDVSDATSLVIYAWDGLGNITPLCVPTKTIAINTEDINAEG